MSAPTASTPPTYAPTAVRFVSGGGGVKLFTRSWGDPQKPAILFLHGWSGSHASWKAQYDSQLAARFFLVAVDQRGSGYSEQPMEASAYQDGTLYADDIRGILDAYQIQRPVVVAWSFSGIVLADYLARYGDAALGGIVLTGSLFGFSPEGPLHMGPAAPLIGAALAPDLDAQYQGLKTFLAAMGGKPLEGAELERETVVSMLTPPHVRAALVQRTIDHRATWQNVQVPVLIIHGDDDQVVQVSAGKEFAHIIPTVQLAIYAAVGHTPFREDPDTLNADLAQFVEQVQAQPAPRHND